jgi:hypothetical protein
MKGFTARMMSATNGGAAYLKEAEAYFAAMRKEYEAAAAQPWEIAPPDPATGAFLP